LVCFDYENTRIGLNQEQANRGEWEISIFALRM